MTSTYPCPWHEVEIERGQHCTACVERYASLPDPKTMTVEQRVAALNDWYDKAILQKAGLDPERPPKTVDELMSAMAAVKKSQPDVIPLGIDTTNRPFSLQANWPWMATFGAQPIGDAKASADSPAMKRYLEWMRELAQKRYIDPCTTDPAVSAISCNLVSPACGLAQMPYTGLSVQGAAPTQDQLATIAT